MATVTAVLIAMYIVTLIAVLAWPRRQRSGDDAQAMGCFGFFIFVLLIFGAVLGVAAHFHIRWLVYVIFSMIATPAVIAAPQLIYHAWKAMRKRAAARGTRISADQLPARLAGQTHVFRYGTQDPPRNWIELRYYAPDGRVVQYEEEAGQLKLIPGEIMWKIEAGRLETLNDIRPGNKNRYTLNDTPDGQIAYYIHAPASAIHGRLSRRTVEIRAGEPK